MAGTPIPALGYDAESRAMRVADQGIVTPGILGVHEIVGDGPFPIYVSPTLSVDEEVNADRIIGAAVYEKWGGWDTNGILSFDSDAPDTISMGEGSHGTITQSVVADDVGNPNLRVQVSTCDSQIIILPYTSGPIPRIGELRLKIRSNVPADQDMFAGFAFYNGQSETDFRGVVFVTACSPAITSCYVMNGSTVQLNAGSMPPGPVTNIDTAWMKVEYEFAQGPFVTNYPPFRVKCEDGYQFMGAASRGPWVFDIGQVERFVPGTVTGFSGEEFNTFGLVVGRIGGTPTDPVDFQFDEIRVIDRTPYFPSLVP